MENTYEESEQSLLGIILSAFLLILGLVLDATHVSWFANTYVRYLWYIVAFIPVGKDVLQMALHSLWHREWMGEQVLMSVAAIGAFAIGELPEAVAVMLLYCIGEALQDKAVDKARDHIKAMLTLQTHAVRVLRNDEWVSEKPENVEIGDVVEVLPGEQLALDGCLITNEATLNMAAITGESVPVLVQSGKEVFAGSIATNAKLQVKVTRKADQSAIARIMNMVEEAAERKAPTDVFIRRFANKYTPIVLILALLTVLLPFVYSLISPQFNYEFSTWLHRAFIFLVISCPCALVISVPLTYFAGIGSAAKRGILFKGSNFIDALSEVDTVVFDKTGTLTTGSFKVKEWSFDNPNHLKTVAIIEQNSTHPLAKAVANGVETGDYKVEVDTLKELAGYGIEALIAGEKWLVGTTKLLEKHAIAVPSHLTSLASTLVVCAYNDEYVGHIVLEDELKDDTEHLVEALNAVGVHKTVVLSGDKQALVESIAQSIGIEEAHGNLLPEGKVAHLERLKSTANKVAFVGDGINDAPVLAVSDVGVAMGAMGSDVAIETADVVLQTDKPMLLVTAIALTKRIKSVVWQNVYLSIGIKVVVMLLGILGIANIWMAVFADTGVTLLAVLNASKLIWQKK